MGTTLCVRDYEFYLAEGEFVSQNGKKAPQTILVAEDHPDLLKLVRKILEDAHFTVLPATDAKEAMRIEAEFAGTIDVLLSDVMMPGMTGPDLAKKLKKHDVRLPQRRIACSELRLALHSKTVHAASLGEQH